MKSRIKITSIEREDDEAGAFYVLNVTEYILNRPGAECHFYDIKYRQFQVRNGSVYIVDDELGCLYDFGGEIESLLLSVVQAIKTVEDVII